MIVKYESTCYCRSLPRCPHTGRGHGFAISQTPSFLVLPPLNASLSLDLGFVTAPPLFSLASCCCYKEEELHVPPAALVGSKHEPSRRNESPAVTPTRHRRSETGVTSKLIPSRFREIATNQDQYPPKGCKENFRQFPSSQRMS